MKKCGLKITPMTSRCIYLGGNDKCLFLGSCIHLEDLPNYGSSAQRPAAPSTSDSNAVKPRQDCSTCEHKTVCKYKEKFETMVKEHFPLLCACQWYKEENHS